MPRRATDERETPTARPAAGLVSRPGSCARGCAAVLAVLTGLTAAIVFANREMDTIPPLARATRPNGYLEVVAAGRRLRASDAPAPPRTYAVVDTTPGMARARAALKGLAASPSASPELYPTFAAYRAAALRAQDARVRANADIVRQARAALRTPTRLPPRYLWPDREDDSYDGIARVSALLRDEADVAAGRGAYEAAFDSCLTVAELAADLARDATALEATCTDRLAERMDARHAVWMDRLSARACDRFRARLEDMARRRPTAATLMAAFRRAAERELPGRIGAAYAGVDASSGGSDPADYRPLALFSQPADAWSAARSRATWRRNRTKWLREADVYLRSCEREAAKPFPARRWPDDLANPLHDWLFGHVEMMQTLDRRVARDRLLVCALAVRAYRLRRGSLPNSLATAGVPADLRQDPFSGRDFVYRRAGGDYLLYSVGPDLRDDGGIVVTRTHEFLTNGRPAPTDLGLADAYEWSFGPVFVPPHTRRPPLATGQWVTTWPGSWPSQAYTTFQPVARGPFGYPGPGGPRSP